MRSTARNAVHSLRSRQPTPHHLRSVVVASALSVAAPAKAHHGPADGASDGLKTLNVLRTNVASTRSRLLLLTEASRSSPGTTPSPATSATFSALGEYSPWSWASLGVQIPYTVTAPDGAHEGSEPVRHGLGNVRLLTSAVPLRRAERATMLGLNVTLPTRTFTLPVDPGSVWVVSPLAVYAESSGDFGWQALLQTSIDGRPAGLAWELTAGWLGSHRATPSLTLSLGWLVDVRLLTWCAQPNGTQEPCSGGRATEVDRSQGTTRVHASAGGFWQLHEAGGARLGVQFPMTASRDFDFQVIAGYQLTF